MIKYCILTRSLTDILHLYLEVDLPQVVREAVTVQPPLSSFQPFQQCGPLHQQVSHLFTGGAQAHFPKVLLGQHLRQLFALALWKKGEFLAGL